MASISIETKRLKELQQVTTPISEGLCMVYDDVSTKAIPLDLLFASLIPDGAGAHNAIYRGKKFNSYLDVEIIRGVQQGTFKNLFIGDYWNFGDINYRIAAFDYYLGTSGETTDTTCTKHHMVLVPDTCIGTPQKMYNTSANTGYVSSAMRVSNMDYAKRQINAAWGEYKMTYSTCLTAGASSYHATSVAWVDECDIELLDERMVYGSYVFTPTPNLNPPTKNETLEKTQLPLFALNPSLIKADDSYWLRNLVTNTNYAYVDEYGRANQQVNTNTAGVRPFICVSF